MTLHGFLIFAGIYFVAVATPGPGVALVIARSLGQGLRGLPWFIAGFLVGDAALMTLAVSGLAFIAQTYEAGFHIVRYAGAAYLVWIAWKIWRAPVRQMEIDPTSDGERPFRLFLSSLSLTLGNPKPIVFFVSVMPLVVDMGAMNMETYGALLVAVTLVLPPTLATYAVLADRARRVFRSESALKRINKGTALVMAGAALAIAKT